MKTKETEPKPAVGQKLKIPFFSLDHIFVTLVVFLFASLLAFLSLNLSIFNPLKRALDDFTMTDIYYQIMDSSGANEISDQITMVDMTKQYRREDIARTVQNIMKCKPKVLLVDLIFERIGDNELGNEAIINALSQSDNIILSCKLLDYSAENNQFSNCLFSFFKENKDYNWAYSNVISKFNYGAVREYTTEQYLNGDTIYSLPYLSACRYSGKSPQHELVSKRTIVYSDISFITLPCDSVLQNAKQLKDRIVILGAANEEADMHLTPIGKMAGMKILAYSINSFLNHRVIQKMPQWMTVLLTFILCYLSAYAGIWITKRYEHAYIYIIKVWYFLVAALLAWLGFICFVKYDYEISLLFPLLGLALVEQARLHYNWLIYILTSKTKWKQPQKSIYNKKQ